MKRISISFLLFAGLVLIILGAQQIFSQTGPGGVSTTNLKLWLKADGLSLPNNAAVTTWTDTSGNDNDVTQSLFANKPIFIASAINGYPAVRFDGSNDYLQSSVIAALGQPNTVFVVAKIDAISPNYSFMFDGIDASKRSGIFYKSDQKIGISAPTELTTTSTYAAGSFRIAMGVFAGGSSSIYVNGTSDASGGAGAHEITGFTIGSRYTGTDYFFDGDISEVIVFNVALNAAQRILVENYLSAKYAITPIANDYYSSTTFFRNVAGIGRSGGNNSTPGNSAGMILKDNDFLDVDGDFILAGHNLATNSTTNSYVPSTVKSRWTRIWYVDRTGGAALDNADVIFDFSDAGMSGSPATTANYELLYRASTSGNFSIVPVVNKTLPGGDQMRFIVDVTNLPDGYYTLGIKGPLTITVVVDTVGQGPIGTVTPSGSVSVDYGANQIFTVNALGYQLWQALRGDSLIATMVAHEGTFTVANVTSDITLTVNFAVSTKSAQTPKAGSVIVNEWSQGASANKEWVELLVVGNVDIATKDTLIDLSGIILTNEGTTTYLEFRTHPLWKAVKRGSIILIYNGNNKDDAVPSYDYNFGSDNRVVVASTNTGLSGLFAPVGTFWEFGGSTELFDNSSSSSYPRLFKGSFNSDDRIFGWANEGPGTSVHPGTAQLVYYKSYYSGYTTAANWEIKSYSSGTPGTGNGGDNSTFITGMQNNRPSIKMVPPSSGLYSVGDNLSFNVYLGSEIPAFDIVGVSFKFRRGWQDYFTIQSSFASNPYNSIALFGGNGSALVDYTSEAGIIAYSTFRTNSGTEYDGSGGLVVTVGLTVANTIPNEANINFFITDAYAMLKDGRTIPLTQLTYQYYVVFSTSSPYNRVGQGDSDHDGTVAVNDILPIGIFYGNQGGAYSRPWPMCTKVIRDTWGVDAGRNPLTDGWAMWSDNNGDGRVDNLDVLHVGLCISTVYTYPKLPVSYPLSNNTILAKLMDENGKLVSKPQPGKIYQIAYYLDKAEDMLGIAFYLNWDSNFEILNYKVAPELLTNTTDFLELVKYSNESKNAAVGLSRIALDGSISKQSEFEIIRFTIKVADNAKNIDMNVANAVMSLKSGKKLGVKGDISTIDILPSQFALSQNYPNPFNPTTKIAFDLPEASKVSIKVFNGIGQLVATVLQNELLDAGRYERSFNASGLASGIYIYQLSSDKFTAYKKMLMIK